MNRNENPKPGRPVTEQEVAVHASDSCRSCAGRGFLTKIVGNKAVLDKAGKPVLRKNGKPRKTPVRKQLLCRCALKEFRVAFGGVTVEVKTESHDHTVTTALHWPDPDSLVANGALIHASTTAGRPACLDESDIVETTRPITCPKCVERIDPRTPDE